MREAKKIVLDKSTAQITEKKSRFIASCLPAASEEEAAELIAKERKRYFDARHTCFAYVCGENNEITRFSDDGEPRGTAGKPILDVIEGTNLKNALITVTRYFGGTLLGTGGLVRAYSSSAALAVSEGIKAGTILETARGAQIIITIDYKDTGRFEQLCKEKNITAAQRQFSEKATYILPVREEEIEGLEKDSVNITNGNIKIIKGEIQDLIF